MLQQTEDLLEVAANGDATQDLLIVIDRRGGIRMLDPAGWSMGGLRAELGAQAVYRVERRDGSVRVEGRAGSERCLVERSLSRPSLRDLPGSPSVCLPIVFEVRALPAA